MKFVMTLNTEDHGLSVSLHHLAFPGFFPLEISQLAHMVYLHQSVLGPTPFTSVCEEALSQFRSASVHLRIWDEVGVAICDFPLLQLPGGRDQFVVPGGFSLSFERHYIAVWSPFKTTRNFLERALPFVCQCSQETTCCHPENVIRD